MELHDVERIARDVLSVNAFPVSLIRVASIDRGWRVTAVDLAGRVIMTDVVADKPAAVRTALNEWLDRDL